MIGGMLMRSRPINATIVALLKPYSRREEAAVEGSREETLRPNTVSASLCFAPAGRYAQPKTQSLVSAMGEDALLLLL